MILTRGLNHLTLRVSDLDRSIRFYGELLGFRLRWRSPSSAYLEAGSLWLALLLRDVEPFSDRAAGLDHFALTVEEKEFDGAVEELAARGIELVKGPLTRGVGRSVYFRDPDGILVELHTSDLDSRLKGTKGVGSGR